VGPAGIGELTGGDQPQISFCASTPLLQHKLLLQTQSGQSFEAEVNIYPEALYRAPLDAIPEVVVAAQIKNPDGEPVATFGTLSSELSPMIHAFAGTGVPWVLPRDYDDATLLALTSDVGLRVPAYLELAARATERGDYQRADTSYEHALLFNGDDPLAWWAKSVNRRIGNLDDENAERIELLNAHYLSPLEPCLRAEAFLAQPRNHGKDPSPLLASFNDVPENFIEVACQLIQARFYEEAAYFIDEALRHQNLGMLHYLHAHLLSRKGGMDMEVDSRVQMALKAKFPPMPYRDLEREILTLISIGHELPQVLRDWLNGDFD
jgi:tetratricopeptide (TPR) repeat protein